MQRIITYIIENSNRLLFFLLLTFSLVLTVQQHAYHKSQWVGSVNVVNGAVYEQLYQLKLYLNLKDENEILIQENLKLKQQVLNLKTQIPDAIILDIMMPNVDGYATLEQIKKNNALQDCKVIFLSAKNKESDIQKGLELGASAYLTKPFSLKKLLDQVKELLE